MYMHIYINFHKCVNNKFMWHDYIMFSEARLGSVVDRLLILVQGVIGSIPYGTIELFLVPVSAP